MLPGEPLVARLLVLINATLHSPGLLVVIKASISPDATQKNPEEQRDREPHLVQLTELASFSKAGRASLLAGFFGIASSDFLAFGSALLSLQHWSLFGNTYMSCVLCQLVGFLSVQICPCALSL